MRHRKAASGPALSLHEFAEDVYKRQALQSAGYSTHAIHNNNATFYSRDRVYANFGFETFTSLEYMHDVERNPLGWAKDSVLTEEILKALCSTEGRDLVFTVSVQPHGKYPTEPDVYKRQPFSRHGC